MHAVVNAGVGDFGHEIVDVRPAADTPGDVGLVVLSVGVGPRPISASSTAPTAPETMQWAQGYSGCIGVSMSGSHAASRSVASLPSMSPLRIAVTGRQKL